MRMLFTIILIAILYPVTSITNEAVNRFDSTNSFIDIASSGLEKYNYERFAIETSSFKREYGTLKDRFKVAKNGLDDGSGSGDSSGENESETEHGIENEIENESDDDSRSRNNVTLPVFNVPILSDYLQKSLLSYSSSGNVNITVIQKFTDIDGAIFSTLSNQQIFQTKLAQTINTLLPTINTGNVNFIYALANKTTLYSNSRRLITLSNYIVKYSISFLSPTNDMANITTVFRGYRSKLLTAAVDGNFTTVFRSSVTDIPELSSVILNTRPEIYLSSYPPSSNGKLFITQVFDGINLTSTRSKKGNTRNNFKDIIAGTIQSLLLETRVQDIQVKDVNFETARSYEVEYRIPLRFNRTYASVYANLYTKIITNAVQTGSLTTQLRLAATPTYYNNFRFINASTSIIPNYKFKYSNDGTEDEDESHRNKTKVRSLRIKQEIRNIDLTYLSTTEGYSTFVTIIKETISNSLISIPTSDIEILDYERKTLNGRRILANQGTIDVNSQINLYSTTTDPNAVNTYANDVTNTLNTAVTSGTFNNQFISSAVSNGATQYTTASATTPPTITTAADSSSSTTTTTNKDTFDLLSGGSIGILVAIIVVPLLAIGIGLYIWHKQSVAKSIRQEEDLHNFYSQSSSKEYSNKSSGGGSSNREQFNDALMRNSGRRV